MSALKEEIKSGLSLRVLIIALLWVPVGSVTANLMLYYGGRPGSIGSLAMAPVYVLLIHEAIARMNGKWRFSQQELYILTMLLEVSGGTYLWIQYFPSALYPWIVEPWKSAIGDLVPSIMVPATQEAAEMALYGMKPGDVLNWALYTESIMYWAVFAVIIQAAFPIFWMYMLRKPLVEVEKLPFVRVYPLAYTVNAFSDVDETTNKSRVFDMSRPWNKTFWLFIGIGAVFGFGPWFTEIFPLIPMGEWWGEITFYATEFTTPVMPGAKWWGRIETLYFTMTILLPYDVLVSMLVSVLFFHIIYPFVGIQAGILPYEPGWELAIQSGDIYGYVPPIPYKSMVMNGMIWGFAIVTLYGAWPHLKKAFSTIGGGEYYDQGVNLRVVAIGIVALNIILLGIYIISGVPILPAILLLAIYQVWQITMARWGGETTGQYTVPIADDAWPILYGAGLATGSWGTEIPTTSQAWMTTSVMNATSNWWGTRSGGFSTSWRTGERLAGAVINKVKGASVFWALLILGTISILVNAWVTEAVTIHSGGLNMWFPGYWYRAIGSNVAMSGFGPGASLETYGAGSVAGFIFCVALYWARSRWTFLTLFTNPIGLAHGMWWPEYSNVQVVLALIIKYVAERIGGTRIREERIIPAVVGFNAAFILPRIIAGIYVFFQYTMPTYWTRFVP